MEPALVVQWAAALVGAAFALAVLLGGERRIAHVYLAGFLALVAANQAIEALRVVLAPPVFERWFLLATVFAAFDPLLLLLFAATFPSRGRLARGPALPLALVVSSFLALTAPVVARAAPEDDLAANLHATAYRAYTAVVYLLVLFDARGRLRTQAGAPLLFAALVVAALPTIVRVPGSVFGFLPPEARAAWVLPLVAGSLAATVAVAWLLARAPQGADARARRNVALATGVAFALALLIGWFQLGYLAVRAGLLSALPPGSIAEDLVVAARWTLFGLLASLAVLRHDLLGMPLAARRRGAVVLVGFVAIAAAAAALGVLAAIFPGASLRVTLFEIVIVLVVIVASGAFRGLVARAASFAYGVPMPAVGAEALERYRLALARSRTETATPRVVAKRLLDLRREIGLDEASAAVLERMSDEAGPAPLSAGELVAGRYRIVRLLARGGHARAFLARDETLARDVVVKEALDVGAAGIALREARLASSLSHPNVVRVHDVLRRDEGALIIMEYLPGGSLADRIAELGPLRGVEAERLVEGVLEGLAAVHARGVIHRDLKASNVLLASDGRPKVADFGVARTRREATLGVGGALVGTLSAMAPEQRRGEPATPASDVYAVGLLVKQATAGGLSVGRDAVIAQSLAEDPAARWPDAAAMLAAWRAAR